MSLRFSIFLNVAGVALFAGQLAAAEAAPPAVPNSLLPTQVPTQVANLSARNAQLEETVRAQAATIAHLREELRASPAPTPSTSAESTDGAQTSFLPQVLVSPSARDVVYMIVLVAEQLFGCAWTLVGPDVLPLLAFRWISGIFTFAHVFLQFLPFAAWPWAQCTSGLPWEVHAIYIGVFAWASPGLSGMMDPRLRSSARVPCTDISGKPALLYFYVATFFHAFDQYGDAMVTVIAFSCGFSLAWLMLVVFVVSFVLQNFVVYCTQQRNAGQMLLRSLAGVLPEVATIEVEEWQAAAQRMEAVSGVTRLVTENLPQAFLQYQLLQELDTSDFVYLSICVSICMGIKGFCKGAAYFLSLEYAPAE